MNTWRLNPLDIVPHLKGALWPSGAHTRRVVQRCMSGSTRGAAKPFSMLCVRRGNHHGRIDRSTRELAVRLVGGTSGDRSDCGHLPGVSGRMSHPADSNAVAGTPRRCEKIANGVASRTAALVPGCTAVGKSDGRACPLSVGIGGLCPSVNRGNGYKE